MKKFLVSLVIALLLLIAASYSYYAYKKATAPITYVSTGEMVLVTGKNWLRDSNVYKEALANFFIQQVGIMKGDKIQNRARAHLEATRPELIAKNPRLINYFVSHRKETSFFDLYVQSDNPEYAQFFLQACMDEYLKLRREAQAKTVEITIAAINDELTKLEDEMTSIEDEIETFLTENNMFLIREQLKPTSQISEEKSALFNSKLSEHNRLVAKLDRIKERYRHTMSNFSTVNSSQGFSEHIELMKISKAASPGVKLEPNFGDGLF